MPIEQAELLIDLRVQIPQAGRLFEENLGEDGEEFRRAFGGVGVDAGVVVAFDLVKKRTPKIPGAYGRRAPNRPSSVSLKMPVDTFLVRSS